MTTPLGSPLLRSSDLYSRGMSKADIRKHVETGQLWQVHRGWYAEPGTDAEIIRAMRLGGRLGCVSALRLYGAWCPPDAGMHVGMPRSASGRRMRRPADDDQQQVTAHWRSTAEVQLWSTGVCPLAAAVEQAAQCQPTEYAVAVLDSLLHRRLISSERLRHALLNLPAHRRRLPALLDSRSEEGIESVARYLLRSNGFHAEPQVTIAGIGRADLVIDGWVVIELDGRETHAQQVAFASDRYRDGLMQQRGYTVLRFTYSQVLYDREFILRTVRAVMSRRS